MPDHTRRYGLLLPHFGEHASRKNLLAMSRKAEEYGFDSLWVRDHLVFHPHGMEGQDRTHIEPMEVLGMVAGVTEKVQLGTGSLIPYRNPIHAALCLSSLERLAGPGRVIAGFGIGTFDHEFVASGLGGIDRKELVEEQVAVMRKLWTGEEVSFEGKFYNFTDVDIHPSPVSERSIPIWYCGNSPASARRAVEYCDGWMPGRITIKTFAKRVERLHRLAMQHGKPVPTASAIPITSPGRTREEAISKVNWSEMMEQAIRAKWELPDSGKWEAPEDLEGALIAGPPETIIQEVRKYHAVGGTHLVFDLRFRFDEWEECVGILGEEVLPELRRGDAAGEAKFEAPAEWSQPLPAKA
ncbi:MAG: TIGR03619 family F420-dependent LLM class oxidoreductase [Chloroflexi bacterium]|nr:TIGR03619 family F420-dependent LLM class oxidoreductase [Chloroflexota bacterium]